MIPMTPKFPFFRIDFSKEMSYGDKYESVFRFVPWGCIWTPLCFIYHTEK